MQFTVTGSVILLFATERKWDLDNIKLKAVTAQGIFFDATCPVLVIDTTAKKPMRLFDAEKVFAAAHRDTSVSYRERTYGWNYEKADNIPFVLDMIRQEALMLCGESATRFEKRCLDMYFQHLIKKSDFYFKAATGPTERAEYWMSKAKSAFDALMPIPQAWFYCHDPLQPHAFIPENAFRVDFAFWSGEKFFAIEIDGTEPEGYAFDVRRDRLLRRAGIDVIHVLNSEIMQHGVDIIDALLTQRGPYARI